MVSQRYVLRRQTLTRSGVGGNSVIRNERQTLTRSGGGDNSEIRNVPQTLILIRSGGGGN